MSYTLISPATLPNLLAAVKPDTINTVPLDTESANLAAAVDRQTRQFIYDFLITVFASDSTLLAAAVATATMAGKVTGSSGNAGTQGSVVQGTISTVDLRDLAVTAAKIAANTITAAQIANGTITQTQLASACVGAAQLIAGAVGTAMVANNAITQALLATGAVGTNQLIDLNVTSSKLAANAVTYAKLVQALAGGKLLVSDGSNNWQEVTLSGDLTMDNTGRVTLTNKRIITIFEQQANGVGAGNSSATTTQQRGTGGSPVLIPQYNGAGLVSVPTGDGKIKPVAGTYLIEGSCPGYGVGLHRASIVRYNSGNTLQETLFGSNETIPTSSQNRSFFSGVLTFASGDYFIVNHYTTAAVTNGLGLPTALGTNEIYTMVKLQQIS